MKLLLGILMAGLLLAVSIVPALATSPMDREFVIGLNSDSTTGCSWEPYYRQNKVELIERWYIPDQLPSDAKYESYNTGDDAQNAIYSSFWLAQTFTPTVSHYITSVKLLLWRWGFPGTTVVSIRNTDIDGNPTGVDLCSGTTDSDSLVMNGVGEWREIVLGNGYFLTADTQYAIVVRTPDGAALDEVLWRMDETTPTYSSGCHKRSVNSGDSWTSYIDRDLMFEEWGKLPNGNGGVDYFKFRALSNLPVTITMEYWSSSGDQPLLTRKFSYK